MQMKEPQIFKLILVSGALLTLLLACSGDPAVGNQPGDELPVVSTLLFATGYEPGEAQGSPADAHNSLIFQNTVQNAPLPSPLNIGVFYEDGAVTDRYARIIEDPTEPGNHVLSFWMQNAVIDAGFRNHTKGRVQTDFSPEATPFRSMCSRQRVYLHPDMALMTTYPQNGDAWWLSVTINELWFGAPWRLHPNAARITVAIAADPVTRTLRFIVEAQRMPSFDSIWNVVSDYVVPVGEWLTIETRYHQGDATTGRFVMIVQAESEAAATTVFDVTDFTYDPVADEAGGIGPVPLTNWQPQKLYSSDNVLHWIRDQGGVAQIYFDDFEITSPCAF